MPRSLKKGPFVDDHLLAQGRRAQLLEREACHQDLVAPFDDHPRHGRPHDRRPRRPQARAGLRDRVDGRPQARRVRARRGPSATTPAKNGRGGAEMTGIKTNERPGTRAVLKHSGVSAYKAREVLDLIRGKDYAAGGGDPRVLRPRSGGVIGKLLHSAAGERLSQRRPRSRGAVRLGLLRRRGHDAEALAAPRAGARHPHPQAHLPRHGHPLAHARRGAEPPPRPRRRRGRRSPGAARRRGAPPRTSRQRCPGRDGRRSRRAGRRAGFSRSSPPATPASRQRSTRPSSMRSPLTRGR